MFPEMNDCVACDVCVSVCVLVRLIDKNDTL